MSAPASTVTPELDTWTSMLRDPRVPMAECNAYGRRVLGLPEPRPAAPRIPAQHSP